MRYLGRSTPIVFALLLVAAVFAVYWPGLGGGFAFDDYPNIVDNAALHVKGSGWNEWLAAILSSPSSELKRPLSMLSFAINHYFTGLDPVPMKLGNIALHALNSLLVFALARRLLASVPAPGADAVRDEWLALFASACWALHPINLIAVLLVVQRMELLAHTFVFAGLWLYLVGRQRQLAGEAAWARIVGGLAAGTVLGLLCKESAVLLPLYALGLELCVFGFRGADGRRDRRVLVLFVLLLVIPAIAAVSWLLPRAMADGAYAKRDFSLSERLLTEPRVLLDYLRWTLLPDLGKLSLYHDDYQVSRGWLSPPSTLFAALALAALAVFALLARQRWPLLALGLLWFLGAHLLTASFIPLELVFEHRNYFASLGVCLVLCAFLRSAALSRARLPLRAVLGTLLVLAFAVLTHVRAREWSDPLRFARIEAHKQPQSPRATYELARMLVLLGNYRLDSPFTQEAFQALAQAGRVPRSGVLPEQGLLILAARTGTTLPEGTWESMYAKLRRDPLGVHESAAIGALTRCAVVGLCRFPPESMLELFASAQARGPNAEIINMQGDYALNVLRQPGPALELWRQASRLRPDRAQYRITVATMLIAMGRHEEARAEIAALRRSGRFGQYEAEAARLEAALHTRKASAPPPGRG